MSDIGRASLDVIWFSGATVVVGLALRLVVGWTFSLYEKFRGRVDAIRRAYHDGLKHGENSAKAKAASRMERLAE